jgi:hypothetical protein
MAELEEELKDIEQQLSRWKIRRTRIQFLTTSNDGYNRREYYQDAWALLRDIQWFIDKLEQNRKMLSDELEQNMRIDELEKERIELCSCIVPPAQAESIPIRSDRHSGPLRPTPTHSDPLRSNQLRVNDPIDLDDDPPNPFTRFKQLDNT